MRVSVVGGGGRGLLCIGMSEPIMGNKRQESSFGEVDEQPGQHCYVSDIDHNNSGSY